MRDATGLAYRRLRHATQSLSAYLGGAGYELIDPPLLEETELFVRKSGGELTSQLYTFTDPGGSRVSLRPEFTSSVIRHFIQERGSVSLPVRWQYSGPVFRYQGDDGTYNQFTQVGAELIGAGGVEADAEALFLAWDGLREAGLHDCRVVIGHLGVLYDLMDQLGVSEASKTFAIGSAQELKRGDSTSTALMGRARDAGLLSTSRIFSLGRNGMEIGPDSTREHVVSVLEKEGSTPYGRRTHQEIADRLLREASDADDPERLEAGLALVGELVQLDGSSDATLRGARSAIEARGLRANALDDLGSICAELSRRGVDDARLTIDFGLASDISYYTGVIFSLSYTGEAGEVTVGSGGRYDGLVKALGGEDVAALGYAYNMDRLTEAIGEDDSASSSGT